MNRWEARRWAVVAFGLPNELMIDVAERTNAEAQFNGLRHLLVGKPWIRFESRIPFGRRKSPKMAQNPTSPVDAVLGNIPDSNLSEMSVPKLSGKF